MSSMLFMAVLVGGLAFVRHSWALVANGDGLYANETASRHLGASIEDSWLGWVSIS